MDTADTKGNTLEHPLITTISHVGHMVEAELDHKLKSIDLSITQLGALYHIHQNEKPVPLSELAKQKDCVKSNITQLIDRMESEGLVERVRSEKDRRKVLTVLTPKGEKLYREGYKLLKITEDKILSRLSGQQKEQLACLLNSIVEE